MILFCLQSLTRETVFKYINIAVHICGPLQPGGCFNSPVITSGLVIRTSNFNQTKTAGDEFAHLA
jgi:hypothetical protein